MPIITGLILFFLGALFMLIILPILMASKLYDLESTIMALKQNLKEKEELIQRLIEGNNGSN